METKSLIPIAKQITITDKSETIGILFFMASEDSYILSQVENQPNVASYVHNVLLTYICS